MRVLVVDEDDVLVSALRRGLESSGLAVDVAADGIDGEWMARETAYDVIVLDVMLPGRSGPDVCRHLRADGIWTPVLMLTARGDEKSEAGSLDLGADDFLAKPFSYAVLLARLRALLRRGAPERPVVLEVDDLRLDPATRSVHRGDVEVVLSPRQFSLLEYLMRRRGSVVTKREAIEHVWDSAYDGDVNIVEVYVAQLRRRIDEPFGRRSIVTVRGAGYRLDGDA